MHINFSGVTYNHVFTDTKSQYLFYYILPVKPLNIGSFIFISIIKPNLDRNIVYEIIAIVINKVNITVSSSYIYICGGIGIRW